MAQTTGSGVLSTVLDGITLTASAQSVEVEILDEAASLFQLSYTKGTETSMTFNLQLSTDDGTTYYDAFRGLAPVEETFTATSLERYVLNLPGFINKVKISATGNTIGTAPGTVTVKMRRSSVNNPISI